MLNIVNLNKFCKEKDWVEKKVIVDVNLVKFGCIKVQ